VEWVVLITVIVVLLTVDLLAHRGNHEPTPRRALVESAAWVACGLGFAVVVLAWKGGASFSEYLSGYVIEKSLSIDNVFVWAVIFSSFAIPARYQHRVLFWGIFGALVMRATFIFAGAALIEQFWWMLLVFGAVLLVSGFKVIRHKDDEGEPEHQRAVKLLGRVLPVRAELADEHFVVREAGPAGLRWVATPLLAALVVVEVTDVVFAVDSVPAFAILGLRAMYFLLGDARERFHYLAHALGAILVFVGIKMVASHWWHFPTVASLGVIVVIVAGAIGASLVKSRRLEERAAAARAGGGRDAPSCRP
jgi:tellurite resistance protein TerC